MLLFSLVLSFDNGDKRLLTKVSAGLLLRLLVMVLFILMLLLKVTLLLLVFPLTSASSFLSGVKLGELSITLSLFLEP